MIVVDLDMWPGGDQSQPRALATIAIANVGGDQQIGKYVYAIGHQADPRGRERATAHDLIREAMRVTPSRVFVWKYGTIEHFERRRGAVALLALVLADAFPTADGKQPEAAPAWDEIPL